MLNLLRMHILSYQKPHEQVVKEQNSNVHLGLGHQEVLLRQSKHGLNLLAESKAKSPWSILASQFTDFLTLVLIGAAIIAGFLGDPEDVFVILAIVLLNGSLGFIQEYRAERSLQALKSLSTPRARVKRQGEILDIPSFDLVPGDIVLLEVGNIVPADLRLFECHQLRIDESLLTGESHPIDKTTTEISKSNLSVGDQFNMAFKGSIITAGRGVGIVVSTGMNTELGKIAGLLKQEVEVKTPLQVRLAHFAKRMAFAILGICIFIFMVGLLRGEEIVLMFLTSLSLAVAAIPEALPAVVTISLAIGARRMSKANALIRKLPAVEALGSVTYICSDKTGTLTENKMRVNSLYVDNHSTSFDESIAHNSEPWMTLFRILALNNDAHFSKENLSIGDPTETALLEASRMHSYEKVELEKTFPRIAEIPFSSERGMMTTLHREEDQIIAYIKGAPERVLPLCKDKLSKGGVSPIKSEDELKHIATMTLNGERVLALAYKRISQSTLNFELNTAESELTFVGLVGLIDPPRKEAHEAISLCKSAGIKVVMITGDHPQTAYAIATKLEIASHENQVMTGTDLKVLSDAELKNRIHTLRVFARVAPEQKIQIVKALQDNGDIVAMTGDGVNDAPALRSSDIGVSMGRGGTDVAREASHMILLDDNFASIVKAVREGRRIYDNIRKFIRFALSGNSGEVWTLFLAPILQLPIPLLPIHILWINLVTDGLPGLALALEPEESDSMARPPRSPKESIFAGGLWQHTLWVGLLIGGLSLATFAWGLYTNPTHAQTLAFTTLTFAQMGHVLSIRFERHSSFSRRFFGNPALLATIAFTIFLHLTIIYHPLLRGIFKTMPLTALELGLCSVSAFIIFFAVEIEKKMRSLRLS